MFFFLTWQGTLLILFLQGAYYESLYFYFFQVLTSFFPKYFDAFIVLMASFSIHHNYSLKRLFVVFIFSAEQGLQLQPPRSSSQKLQVTHFSMFSFCLNFLFSLSYYKDINYIIVNVSIIYFMEAITIRLIGNLDIERSFGTQ